MSITEDHVGESQVYEIGYLVLPSIPEENLSNVVNSIDKIIEKNGGKSFDSEAPFRIDLAYSLSKVVGASKYVVNDAYIGWIKFDAEPANVPAIKSELEKIDELLRFLLIKAPRETKFRFADSRKAEEIAESPETASEEALVAVEEPVLAKEGESVE